ncbi:MAG: 1-acyl-sn-glycerol-3-phosphate acyltransferase [Proteobacteria bacterium]|nr:1-acyl-sn-glycerol-3-phosphate acyltransferase [Pseudomonadota bacterium]
MQFEPIAIIGCSCVFPGALTPEELWEQIKNGRDLLSIVPENYWRTDPRLVMADSSKNAFDLTWTDRGGYVKGFESVFRPDGFAIPAAEVQRLDPLIHWILHTAREALNDSGYYGKEGLKTGAIFGNLSYPSHSLQEFSEGFWLDHQSADFLNGKARTLSGVQKTHAINRFMSGFPAHILARSLNFNAGSFAIDAACASSLYAVKLACDRLQERKADIMLAGGINRSDDLIIHIGFCALQAMSQTGRSRPFHKHADGLVPAEGAGFVVLKRLEDAISNGDRIQGVIRGIGLSNDGRGHGLLVPSEEGQFQALKKAYELSGLSPADISMLECHATGTTVGDEIELRSTSRIYKGLSDVPIGTIKSNMGHPITASGIAGIIKILFSFKHGIRPATLHVDEPNETIKTSPFRLLFEAEPWKCNGLKRAGISNFGFGGNNAHVILEEWDRASYKPVTVKRTPPASPVKIAIIGMGMMVSETKGVDEFKDTLFSGRSSLREQNEGIVGGFADPFDLPLMGLKFFPAALDQTLPQQLIMLKATLEAVEDAGILPGEKTAVLVGMGCDAEVTRSGLCWRLQNWAEKWFSQKTPSDSLADWISRAKDHINPLREASAILGAMPNIVANRLNSQFDFSGPSHTISAEEISGLRCLEIAIHGLKNREIDTAVVGAVDMSCEPVHLSAVQDILDEDRKTPGDAAVTLILKRLEDALKDGDKIYAVISDEITPDESLTFGFGNGKINLTKRFGHSHAASGLLHVAAATLSCLHQKIPSMDQKKATFWEPQDGKKRKAEIKINALGGESSTIMVEEHSNGHVKNKERLPKAPKEKKTSRTYKVHPARVMLPPFNPVNGKEAAPTSHVQTAQTSSGALPSGKKTPDMKAAPSLPPVLPMYLSFSPGKALNPRPAIPASHPKSTETLSFASLTQKRLSTGAGHMSTSDKEPTLMKKLLQHLVEKNHQIAGIHKEFLYQQEEVHKRFLNIQQQMLSALSGLSTSSTPYPDAFSNPSARADSQDINFDNSQPSIAFVPPEGNVIVPGLEQMEETPDTPTRLPEPPIDAAEPEPPKAPEISAKKEARKGSTESTAMKALRTLFENPVELKPKGPSFDREQLKILASGKISEVFGPLFEQQDDYEIQVRLPEEPLLLVDRITGIDAEPGSMGKGVIWTETDVTKGAWYIHDIYMPGGITIESGQCDLTLISYLGIDFLNKGERAYRLLGCDLMYYGEPPRVGDTLCYQIHVDGHANMGGQRMFFFRYDCRVNGELRLSVRNGQAAFITPEEAENAGGVLWKPETGEHKPIEESIVETPEIVCTKDHFTKEDVIAFSEGRGYDCFGKGFERLATHSKTPKIPSGQMRLLDEVTKFDPSGGPWGRGYIRVENDIHPDDWFFKGHFKNDPCMPGTLMSEGCMQLLAFYISALGFSSTKDGWRFDPVPNEIFQAKCRSQVTPNSKHLTYEAFIEEVILVDGLYPTVFADLVATCDGKKSLHIRRLGVRLVPDWPLDCWPHLLEDYVETRTVAKIDDMEFGYKSIMACAFGKPSDAFGQPAAIFDTGRHIQRLPGPPYHFMTRVSKIDATPNALKVGDVIEVEYDVPPDSWFFNKNGNKVMPFCVILEVALQPCGWLSCFEGGPASSDKPLYFRNLDGHAVAYKEIKPDVERITTRSTLINVARAGSVLLVRLKAECFDAKGDLIFEVKETAFGFFSAGDLAQQPGLNPKKEEIEWLGSSNDFEVDLTKRPEKYCNGELRLPEDMLLMLDKVTGYWPEGGKKGKGLLRGEKAVDPNEWFFKAHFFNDPVQPGSLGVEAIIQLAQFYMIHEKMDKGIKNPRFTASSIGNNMIFKYRGQVLLDKETISSEVHILETGKDERGAYIIAEGFLWIDNKKIFQVKEFRVDIVSGGHYESDDESDPKPVTSKKKTSPVTELNHSESEAVIKKVSESIGVNENLVRLSDKPGLAVCDARPLKLFPFSIVKHKKGKAEVTLGDAYLDFETMVDYSRKVWNVGPWVGEKFTYGLFSQFTGDIILEDPGAFEKVSDRSLLYLANHQVQSESILFSMIIKVLAKRRTVIISDSIHKKLWTGPLDDLTYKYPGVTYPRTIVYFKQSDRKSMFDILEDFKKQITNEGVSVFLHPEGKRGLSCRHPVKTLSSVFVDLALDANLPIVPVKFSGGLPIEEMKSVRDFPIGYCKQDYYFGKPILPEELKERPYADRRKVVLKAINDLGPSYKTEAPNPPDRDFMKEVKTWMKEKGVNEVQAVLFKILERQAERDDETELFIKRAYDKNVRFGDDPKGKWLSELATWLFE